MPFVLRSPISNRLLMIAAYLAAVGLIVYAVIYHLPNYALMALFAFLFGVMAMLSEFELTYDDRTHRIELKRGVFPFSWVRDYAATDFQAVRCRRHYYYRSGARYTLSLVGTGTTISLCSYSFAFSALNQAHDLAAALQLPIDDETAGGFFDMLNG